MNKRPLSLRDDCRDAGGSATQDAVAERVSERGYKKSSYFDPLPPTLPLRGRE